MNIHAPILHLRYSFPFCRVSLSSIWICLRQACNVFFFYAGVLCYPTHILTSFTSLPSCLSYSLLHIFNFLYILRALILSSDSVTLQALFAVVFHFNFHSHPHWPTEVARKQPQLLYLAGSIIQTIKAITQTITCPSLQLFLPQTKYAHMCWRASLLTHPAKFRATPLNICSEKTRKFLNAGREARRFRVFN